MNAKVLSRGGGSSLSLLRWGFLLTLFFTLSFCSKKSTPSDSSSDSTVDPALGTEISPYTDWIQKVKYDKEYTATAAGFSETLPLDATASTNLYLAGTYDETALAKLNLKPDTQFSGSIYNSDLSENESGGFLASQWGHVTGNYGFSVAGGVKKYIDVGQEGYLVFAWTNTKGEKQFFKVPIKRIK